MVEKTIPMTREGIARLRRELDELRTVRRREVADRIHSARELSTAQNNAEYDDAKNELELVESRIRTLEAQLQQAVLIDEASAQRSSSVQVGSTVVVSMDGKDKTYTIVGSTEVDLASGRISNESPVGRALLGRRVGDEVQIMAPRGVVWLKITRIQ